MTYATDAELGMMDAWTANGTALAADEGRYLLAEVRRLRHLLAVAWRIIEPMPVGYIETFRETREYDRLWLACIELGIVILSPSQVKRFEKLPMEPYQSAVRLYRQRNGMG